MNVVNAFSDFFRGDPFTTSIGSLVEEATQAFVGADLWPLFSRVCQEINHSTTGPKDALRALRRRFSTTAQSNEAVAFHSLLLLETCVLNCGYRFHVVLANRDNLRDFARFAETSTVSVPDHVRHKLLSLLRQWAMQFSNQVDLQEFGNIYSELREQGVCFPEPPSTPLNDTKSTTALLGDTVSLGSPANASPGSAVSKQPPVREPNNEASQIQPSTASRCSRLSTDLSQVRINACVLSDLLTEAESMPVVNEESRVLMSDIAVALREMSRRLVEAISSWETYQETLPSRGTSDSVLLEMLNVNDELHTVLLRYGRLVRAENTTVEQAPTSTPADSGGAPADSQPPEPSADFSSFVGEQSASDHPTPSGPESSRDTVPLVAPSTGSKDDACLIEF